MKSLKQFILEGTPLTQRPFVKQEDPLITAKNNRKERAEELRSKREEEKEEEIVKKIDDFGDEIWDAIVEPLIAKKIVINNDVEWQDGEEYKDETESIETWLPTMWIKIDNTEKNKHIINAIKNFCNRNKSWNDLQDYTDDENDGHYSWGICSEVKDMKNWSSYIKKLKEFAARL